jgi:hypothetical protein
MNKKIEKILAKHVEGLEAELLYANCEWEFWCAFAQDIQQAYETATGKKFNADDTEYYKQWKG